MAYDSAPATLEHIGRVRELLQAVMMDLSRRAAAHDHSKLEPPEKEAFDAMTPRLDEAPFGTPAYKAALEELGPALEHHYAANRHHPEHFTDGVHEMNLLDLLEMLVDWKAAGERDGGTGDLRRSIEENVRRFDLDLCDVAQILLNTVEVLDGR